MNLYSCLTTVHPIILEPVLKYKNDLLVLFENESDFILQYSFVYTHYGSYVFLKSFELCVRIISLFVLILLWSSRIFKGRGRP